jgi:hypothetical protein
MLPTNLSPENTYSHQTKTKKEEEDVSGCSIRAQILKHDML